MATAYPNPLPSRPIHPHISTTCSRSGCGVQLEFLLPLPPPEQRSVLDVRCWKCGTTFQHTFYPGQIPSYYESFITGSSSSGTVNAGAGRSGHRPSESTQKSRSRKIGTQEKPLETAYYDILGVPTDATTDDIKKAYRRLAIKHHPDKNPDDPTAAERFTQIGIAYQTLSDADLRKKYNEFGAKESQPEGGFVDPEEVFGAIFGGDRFFPIIGHIGLASDMKAAMQEDDGDEEEEAKNAIEAKKDPKTLTPEERARKEERDRVKAEKERVRSAEKAAARSERVGQLVENLTRKLMIFTESATGPNDRDVSKSWKTICELEAEDLKRESYGVELLQTIGFVYVAKAKHHLATSQTFLGVGGWLHNVQGKYHVFSETVSTLRSAIELKAVFDQLAAAEKAGGLSPEERKRLEEQAAEKGLQALFKGAKLEIESVLREVCERILTEPNLPRGKSELRAVALQMLGEAYMGVKKDGEAGPTPPGAAPEDDYVKIETKASKSRDKEARQSRGW
ncbi:DnaJ-domain-containing protein [Ephemerocybe angulata]|uniref:DnaJ-domain-containing protein n=1 Tax=Ephemerocybe angulata TaxID=980116 RepID=A0A8H6HV29_9AGAR|nr:DnaJ-domain-containing protein [Tulosesus angulatus]